MTMRFPRNPDSHGHAWGLKSGTPREVWERFSPAYEAQLERIVRAIEARGLTARLGGAGSQDGEYLMALRGDTNFLFQHLEDPGEARRLARMDDQALAAYLDAAISSRSRDGLRPPVPGSGATRRGI